MLEIRYQVTTPGFDTPFASWFRDVPEGRVHGGAMRFTEARATGTFVAMAGEQTKRLLDAVLATPVPNATRWTHVADKHGLAYVEAEWGEPIFANVCSPMRVAWGLYGDSARYSCTIQREVVTQRILVPARLHTDRLWPQLRDELLRYAGFLGGEAYVEIQRVGPIRWGEGVPLDLWPASFVPAFEVGRFDDPPTSSLEEVARHVGVPERTVLAELGELEW